MLIHKQKVQSGAKYKNIIFTSKQISGSSYTDPRNFVEQGGFYFRHFTVIHDINCLNTSKRRKFTFWHKYFEFKVWMEHNYGNRARNMKKKIDREGVKTVNKTLNKFRKPTNVGTICKKKLR